MTDARWHLPDGELADRLERSYQYWESEGRAGSIFVAAGEDLRNLDLGEKVLAGAQLQGADLRGSRLDSANLGRASLDGALLDGAHLFNANGTRASLMKASLDSVEAPRSVWSEAVFTSARLTNARYTDAHFQRCDFSRADLTWADLSRADFRSAIFVDAELAQANLAGANIDGALVSRFTLSEALHANDFVGEPVEPRPEAGPTDSTAGERSSFGASVRDALTSIEGAQVHTTGGSAGGQPEFVVAFPGPRYVAVEPALRLEPGLREALAMRADLLVVPDRLPLQLTEKGTGTPEIVNLSQIGEHMLRWVESGRSSGKGGVALATRQARRLRPYLLVAEQVERDPSLISRLSVWLDTGRQDPSVLIPGSDRALADMIPAHLDAGGLARGVRWVQQRRPTITEFQRQTMQAWRRSGRDSAQADRLATEGWDLENALAAEVGSRDRGGPDRPAR